MLVEGLEQTGEVLRMLADRVCGGQQQLVRLHPGQDVGDFHDVGHLHRPLEPRGTGDEPCALHARQLENIGDREGPGGECAVTANHGCQFLLTGNRFLGII